MIYNITDNEYLEIERLREDGVKFKDIKRKLFARYPKLPVPTLRKKFYFWLNLSDTPLTPERGLDSGSGVVWNPQGDTATLSYEGPRDPRLGMVISTLDELLEVGQVDQSVWRVARFRDNAWGQNSALHGYTTIYHVTAWLERIIPANAEEAIALALEELRAAAPVTLYEPYEYTGPKEKVMIEVNLSDIHAGKRGWKAETGTEYNIQIARQRVQAACSQLLAHTMAYHIEHVVIAICGDTVNADGPDGKTTRGTQQDMAGQYLEIFRAAKAMMVEAIMLFRKIAPVKVIIVSGNHDKYTSYLLADMLEAMFANDERVAIDNDPLPRKYHKYGKNLIGFAHRPDFKKLPGLMTVEQPRLWGETTHHEFHAGHFHIERVEVDTIYGVVVRTVLALTGSDEWHVEAGFRGRAGAQMFIWHKEDNLVGSFRAYV